MVKHSGHLHSWASSLILALALLTSNSITSAAPSASSSSRNETSQLAERDELAEGWSLPVVASTMPLLPSLKPVEFQPLENSVIGRESGRWTTSDQAGGAAIFKRGQLESFSSEATGLGDLEALDELKKMHRRSSALGAASSLVSGDEQDDTPEHNRDQQQQQQQQRRRQRLNHLRRLMDNRRLRAIIQEAGNRARLRQQAAGNLATNGALSEWLVKQEQRNRQRKSQGRVEPIGASVAKQTVDVAGKQQRLANLQQFVASGQQQQTTDNNKPFLQPPVEWPILVERRTEEQLFDSTSSPDLTARFLGNNVELLDEEEEEQQQQEPHSSQLANPLRMGEFGSHISLLTTRKKVQPSWLFDLLSGNGDELAAHETTIEQPKYTVDGSEGAIGYGALGKLGLASAAVASGQPVLKSRNFIIHSSPSQIQARQQQQQQRSLKLPEAEESATDKRDKNPTEAATADNEEQQEAMMIMDLDSNYLPRIARAAMM